MGRKFFFKLCSVWFSYNDWFPLDWCSLWSSVQVHRWRSRYLAGGRFCYVNVVCWLESSYIGDNLNISESPPCWSRGWLLIEELYGYLEICHCSVLGLRIWKSQQGRRHLIHGYMVIKGLSGLCVPSDWS